MGTVTHSFVNNVADDPAAAAAGETLPSHWNANHTLALTSSDVGLGNVDNVSEATILAAAAASAAGLYAPITTTRVSYTADTTINVSTAAQLTAALVTASQVDFGGHTLTIQLANGTYTAPPRFLIPVTVGQGLPANLIIRGDPTTPSNVIIAGSSNFAGSIQAGAGARCRCTGIQFTGIANSFGMHADSGGYIEYTAVDFNTGLFAGVVAESGGSHVCVGTLTVSASMTAAIYATNGGYGFQVGSVVTTANTPAWTAGYGWADGLAFLRVAGGTTFGGTGATGTRYSVQRNGVIDVSGAGATYFPGTVAGFSATGGIYS